ncbi:Crp/Fnr family transcriptional regulator [Sphingomonas kyeonggiensis]|uniref:CRP-like cAMP-binding protein n=1 Tax=Sphingomonas kyeonggiensis TaxID=1268553 RepID=A0A7W6NVZ2_9SPHN|nr:Crp/Fnr family transcriptional regulator [Sphingomonas kyeonggiensis]MBB4097116.1 CRP-like cAMP-binding protein [Sphingomonas kyeonggiensis]
MKKLRLRCEVSASEEEALRAVLQGPFDHQAEQVIVRRGERLNSSILLLEGLLARYKDLSDGQRQITHIHVPGDFADLHGYTLGYLDHNLITLTPCRIARAPHTGLLAITNRFPHLTRAFWFSTNLDASIHREWEVSLGRRKAIERAAHLLCELQSRLLVVGAAEGDSFRLPITQNQFAECLGLTGVHVNRVLRELREAGLADFRGGRVTIHDRPGLEGLAEFDPLYLYLDRPAN